MSRVDAQALAAYVGGLEQSSAQLRELAPSLPRVLVRDEDTELVRGVTDQLRSHAQAGVEQLHGTPYEATAWSSYDDVTRAVSELRAPTRAGVSRLADGLDAGIVSTRAQLDDVRRATFDADVSEGGTRGKAAIDELVGAIDTLVQPGARFDGVEAAVAGDALAATSWRLPMRPALEGVDSLERLAGDAATDPRRAFDLQRVLAAWRPTLADEFVPGEELAAQARAIVDRGADDLGPDDWRELVRIADADPAGAYVRRPGTANVADVAYEAIQRSGGPATWNEQVMVEGMSLALARADADLGVLRRQARALLRDGSSDFGEREWARLAELARLDPNYRVLPTTDAHSMRRALEDTLVERRRSGLPYALRPEGRSAGDYSARELAEHWRGHLFGVGANVRMRLLDGGMDAALRGISRIETAAGGLTDEMPAPATRGEAARRVAGFVGKVTARSVASGIRRGVEAITPARVTAEQFDAALRGGPIPARLTVGDLPRFEQWRDTPPMARVSLLARLVARQEPTSAAESRTMIRQARKLPIDESVLSPGLRQRWREALAAVDREDRSLRAVGAYREGYVGHADYASLGRVRSTLELIGLELGATSQVEQLEAQAARTAAAAPATAARAVAGEAPVDAVAKQVDDVDWAIAEDPVGAIDEVLSW